MGAHMEIPFAIGETVWKIGHDTTETWITCPECNGDRALTLIKGNGERVSLDCNYCQRGYDRPEGIVRRYVYGSKPTPFTCTRICGFSDGLPDYTEAGADSNCYTFAHARDLFRDKDECQAACDKRNAEQAQRQEEQAIAQLSSKRSSLSHSSHYWKMEISRMERDLERARARLAVCKHTPTPRAKA